MRASCQNHEALLVIQHSHLGSSSSPLELGTVPPPVTCLQTGHGRVLFVHFWAQWLVDPFEAFPLAGLPLGESG